MVVVVVVVVTHTHTHPFNGPFSGTTQVSWYQKGKTNLDFTEARDSEWQWHQLGHMQVCTSFKTDNHASTPPLTFLQSGCPSCRPTMSKHFHISSNISEYLILWDSNLCYALLHVTLIVCFNICMFYTVHYS